MDAYWQNYIDGIFCDGGAGRIEVQDPSTGEKLAEQALASVEDIDRAVKAAQRVYLSGEFADLHPMERGRMVRAMGQFLAENADEIKRTITLEQGKPLFEADAELKASIRFFEYFGAMAESIEGKTVPGDASRFDFTIYKPLGVSAQFMPCHYPIYILARALAPALVTGNSCVMKTSETAPLSAGWLARAAEAAGFPAGTVNILCGRRQEAGAALAGHPDIDHIVFVGNPDSAADVISKASRNLVPSIVEVGGTSPTIIYEDGDLDEFIDAARRGSYWNAGQFCCGMYRIIVHESRHDELVDRAVALAELMQVGPGIESSEFSPYMGPLDSDRQLQKVLGIVKDATTQDARCLIGGSRLKGDGSFMRPTVLADVTPSMRAAQEEIFGPVMAIMKFHEEADAIKIANSARHSGLMCNIFTQDMGRMMRSANKIRAGHIVSNQSAIGGAEIPFGGFARAGYGSLKGREALQGYVQRKNILIKM
ncbi:aldehyde dehydrogenase [Rhizobium sp. Root1203]|nr:aldehyde dehydrogenase [Rhizobium sp. Root1203]